MKLFRFGWMIAAALLAAAAAAQQKPPEPAAHKIGFVDMARVLRESRASQQVQKSLEAEIQKREKEIAAGAKDQVERRKLALADDINLRRDQELKQFVDKANVIVRRIALAEKLDAVFFEAIYVDVRIDMTAKVIKELDARP